MSGPQDLSSIVRRVVGRLTSGQPGGPPRTAGVQVAAAAPRPGERPGQGASADRWITAEDVGQGTPRPAGQTWTPLAEELAWERGQALESPQVVALACDHGGFKLKGAIAAELTRLGWGVLDLGTHSDAAVDYPDFALAAAEAVASRRARFGVAIDGAGIGSAMAANKVPGVRAANGSSIALARNAREHNYANVLTLGSGQLDASAAVEILRAFLETPEGAARHGRRVDKITAIEARYSATAAARA